MVLDNWNRPPGVSYRITITLRNPLRVHILHDYARLLQLLWGIGGWCYCLFCLLFSAQAVGLWTVLTRMRLQCTVSCFGLA